MPKGQRAIGLRDQGSIHDAVNGIGLAGGPLQDVWNSQGVQNTVRNMQEREVRTQWAGALASATQGGALCPILTS